jgi:hypothetical protein
MKAKFNEIIKNFGVLNGFLYLLGTLLKRLKINSVDIIKYYILVQPVQDQILPAGRGKDIEIKEVKYDSSEKSDFPRPFVTINWRYESGSICLAAYKKQKFAAYLWLAKDMYQEDTVRCDYYLYPEGKIFWDYDVYVVPKYRYGFTFAKLWEAANSYIKKEGGVATMSRVSAFNLESIRSHKRLGTVQLGSLTFLVLGRIQIMCSTFNPYLHIGLSRKSRAKLRLDCPDKLLKR